MGTCTCSKSDTYLQTPHTSNSIAQKSSQETIANQTIEKTPNDTSKKASAKKTSFF